MLLRHHKVFFNTPWQNMFREAMMGFDGRMEYSDGEWWQSTTPSNVRCFRRSVITGTFPYVVSR
jgi:hypothetical protein